MTSDEYNKRLEKFAKDYEAFIMHHGEYLKELVNFNKSMDKVFLDIAKEMVDKTLDNYQAPKLMKLEEGTPYNANDLAKTLKENSQQSLAHLKEKTK